MHSDCIAQDENSLYSGVVLPSRRRPHWIIVGGFTGLDSAAADRMVYGRTVQLLRTEAAALRQLYDKKEL